jgi:lipoprotein-anchoring transpeptidase ErfK/SrfK
VVGVEDKQIGTYDSAGVFTPIPGGSDVVLDGKVFMPPWGSPNRFYPEILGTRRLKLTAEYAIHGTNKPSSVGRASSHGCIRLTNPDIEALYKEVRVGTPVFIY